MPNFKIDECRTCQRPIIWTVTAKGQRVPVDSEPALAGGYISVTYRGRQQAPLAQFRTVIQQATHGTLYRSHTKTCPDADAWRERGRSGAAARVHGRRRS